MITHKFTAVEKPYVNGRDITLGTIFSGRVDGYPFRLWVKAKRYAESCFFMPLDATEDEFTSFAETASFGDYVPYNVKQVG